MNITLTRPISYKDTELDTITLDLDSLTGNDLVEAETNLKRTHPDAPLWGTQHTAYIAAKSAHLPGEVIMKLPVRDFMKVNMGVMNFFGEMVSDISAPEITDD